MRAASILLLAASTAAASAQIDKASLKTKLEDEAGARWIYDDIEAGFGGGQGVGQAVAYRASLHQMSGLC